MNNLKDILTDILEILEMLNKYCPITHDRILQVYDKVEKLEFKDENI